MADFAYSQSEMDAAEELDSSRIQTIINFTGGVVAVVLIAGMITWGWQLLVRDVSGVPVIEAQQGAMRIEPADPGGSQADHQGLAVNRIAEGQEAAPTADTIVLAPPPVELAENLPAPAQTPLPVVPEVTETPALASVAEAPAADEAAALETAAMDAPAPLPNPLAAPTPEDAAAATSALIEQLLADGAQPIEVSARVEILDISVAGLRSSLIPSPRPGSVEAAGALAAEEAQAAAVTTEIDPATLATGTRLVQLGAYDLPAQARDEWERLAAVHPDSFSGRDRIVQETVSGGETFFRLRVHGFADLMDARRFCNALLADGDTCIPVNVQ